MNIDFHAHLLPAADHGSDGLQTSRRQLQLAREAGIDRVIATPHFYPRHEELDPFSRAVPRLRPCCGERPPRPL